MGVDEGRERLEALFVPQGAIPATGDILIRGLTGLKALPVGNDGQVPRAEHTAEDRVVYSDAPYLLRRSHSYLIAASGGGFVSLHDAMVFLGPYLIEPGYHATLILDDGTWAMPGEWFVSHPCSDRIMVVGRSGYQKAMSGVVSSSGTPGSYSIVVQLDTVTDVSVNDYARFDGATGGTNPSYMNGSHRVTAVDGGTSRITVLSKGSGVPSGAVTCTVKVRKTMLDWSVAATDGIVCNGHESSLGGLDNLVLVGPGASKTAITAHYGGSVVCGPDLDIVNWGTGISAQYGGSVYARNIAIEGCATGILTAEAGSVDAAGVVYCGNTVDRQRNLAVDITNLLVNPGCEIWMAGAGPFTANNAYTCERHQIILAGTDTLSVTQEGTIKKADSQYSAKTVFVLGTGAGATRHKQRLKTSDGWHGLLGKVISVRKPTWAGAASAVRAVITTDGTGGTSTFSGYHPGNSDWANLDVGGVRVPADATYIDIGLAYAASVTAYEDNAMLVLGSLPVDYVPLTAAEEWARSQRYRQTGSFYDTGRSIGDGGGNFFIFLSWPVSRKAVASPSVAWSNQSMTLTSGGANRYTLDGWNTYSGMSATADRVLVTYARGGNPGIQDFILSADWVLTANP